MRAKRVDNNQAEIVKALRQAGWHCTDLSAVGGGVPDLLVTQFGQAHLIEIKTDERKYYFTPAQLDYQQQCKANIFVVKSVDEVILFVNGKLKPVNCELNYRKGELTHGKTKAGLAQSGH
jgi:Holliday junction resolvase